MGYEVVFFVLHSSISFCYLINCMVKKMKDERPTELIRYLWNLLEGRLKSCVEQVIVVLNAL